VVLWLTAFLITQVVEVPIYLLALARRPAWQRPLLGFGASTLTHPLVWVLTYRLATLVGFWPAVACTEALAVVVEATYLRVLGVRDALLWALGANAASFGIGLLLQALGVWP
jgi:hypothetical protein